MIRRLFSRTRVYSSGVSIATLPSKSAFSTVPVRKMAATNIFDNMKADEVDGVLTHTVDRYDGVIINSNSLPSDIVTFQSILESSLDFWKINRRRGIWLKVPIEKSSLIAPAVASGFVFHHAEKDYVMMNHWLSEEENRMPANATHQVGVGCIVINNGKLLVVQEKNGPLRGTGIWKMPTGLSDAGEDLYEAAVREVKEETGIDTEFISIINIRQSHTALFGKSDLFFVCLLKPKNTTIEMQPAEISACEWIDAEEYLQQEFFMKIPPFVVVHEQVRQAVQAVASDPSWVITPDSERTVGGLTDNNASEGSEKDQAVTPLKFKGLSPATSDSLPLPSLVVSKLSNGFRPGESVIYHFPVSL